MVIPIQNIVNRTVKLSQTPPARSALPTLVMCALRVLIARNPARTTSLWTSHQTNGRTLGLGWQTGCNLRLASCTSVAMQHERLLFTTQRLANHLHQLLS